MTEIAFGFLGFFLGACITLGIKTMLEFYKKPKELPENVSRKEEIREEIKNLILEYNKMEGRALNSIYTFDSFDNKTKIIFKIKEDDCNEFELTERK